MNAFKGWHIIVLLVVILLLFGARRLPDLARSVGESLRIFKREVKDLTDDDTPSTGTPAAGSNPSSAAPAPTTAVSPPPPAPAAPTASDQQPPTSGGPTPAP